MNSTTPAAAAFTVAPALAAMLTELAPRVTEGTTLTLPSTGCAKLRGALPERGFNTVPPPLEGVRMFLGPWLSVRPSYPLPFSFGNFHLVVCAVGRHDGASLTFAGIARSQRPSLCALPVLASGFQKFSGQHQSCYPCVQFIVHRGFASSRTSCAFSSSVFLLAAVMNS